MSKLVHLVLNIFILSININQYKLLKSTLRSIYYTLLLIVMTIKKRDKTTQSSLHKKIKCSNYTLFKSFDSDFLNSYISVYILVLKYFKCISIATINEKTV